MPFWFHSVNLGFLENSNNVSDLFKLSISMGKLETKMQFKKFYVKIVKSGFWKSGCHGNGVIGTGVINTPLSSPIYFMKSHQISQYSLRRYESLKLARVLCASPPPCKIGLTLFSLGGGGGGKCPRRFQLMRTSLIFMQYLPNVATFTKIYWRTNFASRVSHVAMEAPFSTPC